MTPKLRFAPSPTGNLHIGSARTAIFNWVWAKALNATLVLRIEDTDSERSKKAFEDNIMDGLNWLGIQFDESPDLPKGKMKYRQSERIENNTYTKYINQLIESGDAYYCFETDEELRVERKAADDAGIPYMYSRRSLQFTPEQVQEKLADRTPYTIRFKVPSDQQIVVKDAVRGDISFESNLISDFIIVKSDGNPTYNFVVVADDYDMGITHVVRGEDHISNTPKQLMIYAAFGWDFPQYAHLPIILGTDRSKLSKRHGAKSVSEFRDDGFLSHALINYLSLLGWSPPDEKEILSLNELIDLFDVTRINKAGAVFDIVKLTWMNKQYLSVLSDAEFLSLVQPFLSDEKSSIKNCEKKIQTVRDNVEVFGRINHYLEVYEKTDQTWFADYAKLSHSEMDIKVVQYAYSEMIQLENWNAEIVKDLIEKTMNALSVGKGKVMKPFRKSMTGEDSGPNLVDCLALFPLERLLKRLQMVLEHANSSSSS